ncbi:MAG: ABC transporter permease [Chloroflexota bacterium]|nr:ABC transporter permease [Chloroflexota bacterium]
MAREVTGERMAATPATPITLQMDRHGRDGFWRRLRTQPAALFGIAVMALLLFMALFAAVIAPGDPFATSREVFLPPSAAHPFGTDDLGRDLYRSVVHGARASLLVGLVTAGIATMIGVVVGGVAGYVGGFTDDILMRVTELFQVIPRFFLVLITVALFGSSIRTVILLLGLTYWPGAARLLRGQVLSLRNREHVTAARAIGVRESAILARHVLPLALPPIITLSALTVGGAILVEAGLSFLGLGDRNVVSWGALLNDAQQFVRRAWWLSAFPGLAITLTVLGTNLLADGLNEAWNPRLSRR